MEYCLLPENECEACRIIRSLIDKALKNRDIWYVHKVLPSGDQCSINLSSKNFKKFWANWWSEEEIPQLDIDILVVLDEEVVAEDSGVRLGKPTLLGIEVKYFKKGCNMNFYKGVDQALAYLRIGLDRATLLHIFHSEYPEERVKVFAKTCEALVKGLKLPIAYVACKLLSNGKFRVYTTYHEPQDVTIKEIIHLLKQAPLNPMYSNILYANEVIRMRQTLMALLQIPVMYT